MMMEMEMIVVSVVVVVNWPNCNIELIKVLRLHLAFDTAIQPPIIVG